MDAERWIEEFARSLGAEAPSSEEVERILELAGVAAHASERRAAPVACWVAASAERSPAEALEAAKEI